MMGLCALCFVGRTAIARPPVSLSGSSSATSVGQDADAELDALLADERVEAQRLIDSARFAEARRLLDEHLGDEPGDWQSRGLRGRLLLAQAKYPSARADLERALKDAGAAASDGMRLDLAELEWTLGMLDAATAQLDAAMAESSRRAWLRASVQREAGNWVGSLATLRNLGPVEAAPPTDPGREWQEFFYRARCERALGQLSAASFSLVSADRAAAGKSADVLAELASVYFEADGEVALAGSASRRPAELYREALELAPEHPTALLGMYRLHDLNWRRSSQSARSFLVALLDDKPDHVAGQLALAEDHLKNGEFKAARERIGALENLAPGRIETQALRAALQWSTDDVQPAEATLAELAQFAPWDSAPERLVGEVLLDLYRFQDALAFLERAVERNPEDWRAWSGLGEARSNTGDEVGGLEALQKAKDAAAGRQDAWRNNQMLVLKKMQSKWIEIEGQGRLTYALPPDGHELLARILAPFYYESRNDLASRYGLTPGPVRIEVFDRHADFSVRSTGFEGFPALGVCFGPVVTALSPLSEMRGNFSWAETSYHEFSHVVHLALTRNRCPRWITEGLATWEEERKNPSWTRNMRRELVDNLAMNAIIGVRDLNRAFRGPRIIWAYYQGGLMCEMLIDAYGFPAMVDFLEAFNDGLELDAAVQRAYGMTPEKLDADFLAFVRDYTADLHIEPRHDADALRVLRYSLDKTPPVDDKARAAWAESWTDIAWSAWQEQRTVDAESALRNLSLAGMAPARAEFLRGEMALASDNRVAAIEHYDAGFAAGGRDYRASMARGSLANEAGDKAAALRHFQDAERAFPGWAEQAFSAELAQVAWHETEGQTDAAMEARERYARWNAGDAAIRLKVGQWRLGKGTDVDLELALRHFTEAIEVDPFSVLAHRSRGEALLGLDRATEAVEAFELALLVPLDLDLTWAKASEPARANQVAEIEALLEEARKAGSEG